MCISKKNCPVPFEQQPLNEYFALKESNFFSWSIDGKKKFFSIIAYISFLLFIACLPLTISVISFNKYFIKCIILNLGIVSCILLLIFLRLYLGWSYVIKRLLSATVFYEESGWYDGQIWIKTADSLMQDRLIGLYELLPFIKRIKYSFVCVLFLFIVDVIFYYLL